MIIQADDVSFSYGNSLVALQNISFAISAGERVALTGHNGSGKSTLVKHFNGLLLPSAGKVWIDGVDTSTVHTAQLAGQVALLFQNPDDQICKRTVWDEVVFGAKNLGYSPSRITALVEEALSLLALTHCKRSNPHDCGYSERKRIMMASIVAMDTPVIVFDEPTAGLDPHEISLFIAMLDELQKRNKTIIIISHDMDFVAENMARVMLLAEGRMVFDGPVGELFTRTELITSSGLCQPQVVQLGYACGLPEALMSPLECVKALEEQYRCIHSERSGNPDRPASLVLGEETPGG